MSKETNNERIRKFEIISDDEFIEAYEKSKNMGEFYKNLGYQSSSSVQRDSIYGIKERMADLNLDEHKINKNISREIHECAGCGTPTKNKKFCSAECMREYNKRCKIETWKKTGDTGCGVSTTLRNCIRSYIQEAQNNCCAICGISNKWNGKELKFILDHIDGDASNDLENNLRLICPNCDSQLDTFKSKNKNSARKFRRNNLDILVDGCENNISI